MLQRFLSHYEYSPICTYCMLIAQYCCCYFLAHTLYTLRYNKVYSLYPNSIECILWSLNWVLVVHKHLTGIWFVFSHVQYTNIHLFILVYFVYTYAIYEWVKGKTEFGICKSKREREQKGYENFCYQLASVPLTELLVRIYVLCFCFLIVLQFVWKILFFFVFTIIYSYIWYRMHTPKKHIKLISFQKHGDNCWILPEIKLTRLAESWNWMVLYYVFLFFFFFTCFYSEKFTFI